MEAEARGGARRGKGREGWACAKGSAAARGGGKGVVVVSEVGGPMRSLSRWAGGWRKVRSRWVDRVVLGQGGGPMRPPSRYSAGGRAFQSTRLLGGGCVDQVVVGGGGWVESSDERRVGFGGAIWWGMKAGVWGLRN